MAKLLDVFRDRVKSGSGFPLLDLLNMRVEDYEPGRALVSMTVGPQHHNPMGTMHGGIYCDLADMAMGIAFFAGLGEGEAMTTIELKINYLRPLVHGRATAEARVVSKGNTTGLVECDVRDNEGRLAARASSTCYILRGERAEGMIRAMSGDSAAKE